MAVYHDKSTGTKSNGTGSSTADVWTDANCYNGTQVQNVFNQQSTGDEIIFADSSVDVGSITIPSQINLGNGVGSAVTLTIKSKGGDASLCTISGSMASNNIFAHNSSLYAHAISYENITFTKSVIHIGTAAAIAAFSQATANATFTNSIFDSIPCAATNSSDVGLLFQPVAGTARTITFTGDTLSNLALSAQSRPGFISTVDANDIVITSMTLENISLTSTNGSVRGLFYNAGTGTLTADGVTASNLTFNGDDSTSVNGIFYQPVTGLVMTLSNINVDGVTLLGTAGGCNAPLAYGAVSFTLSDSSITNAVNDNNGNSIGCLALVGTTGTAIVKDSSSYGNRGFYGTGAYNAFSATITVKRVKSYNNDGGAAGLGSAGEDIEGVDFYSGGSGDATYNSCESYGATVQSGAASSSVFAMNNTASTRIDRNKTVTYTGSTFTDDGTGGTMPLMILVNNNATTNSLTVNLTNCIIRSNSTIDVKLKASTASTDLDVNTTNCNYANIDISEYSVGTLTETGNVSTDPLFVSATDHRLGPNSPAKGAGVFVSWQDRDVRGRRRSVPPSLGAYEPTSGDPSDDRNAATTRTVSTTRTAAITRTAA